jgi:hypothetical protein
MLYQSLSRDIMEPIAQTLVDAILEQTRGAPHKEENFVAGEADHNILADVVLRELRNYMSDGFLEAYIMNNSRRRLEWLREGYPTTKPDESTRVRSSTEQKYLY